MSIFMSEFTLQDPRRLLGLCHLQRYNWGLARRPGHCTNLSVVDLFNHQPNDEDATRIKLHDIQNPKQGPIQRMWCIFICSICMLHIGTAMSGGVTTKYWLSQTGLEPRAEPIHQPFHPDQSKGAAFKDFIDFMSYRQSVANRPCYCTFFWTGFFPPKFDIETKLPFIEFTRFCLPKVPQIHDREFLHSWTRWCTGYHLLWICQRFARAMSMPKGRLPGFGGLWNFCHEDHPFRSCASCLQCTQGDQF